MSEVQERAPESTALVVLPKAELIFVPGGAAPLLSTIKQRARDEAAKIDAATPKGRAALTTLAYNLRRMKVAMDDAGKDLKAAYQSKITPIDAERRTIREDMAELADEIERPVAEFKAREAARVAAHEAALTEIDGWATIPAEWTAAQIAARIDELKAHPHLTRDWQEFKDRGQSAARNAYNALRVARADAADREAAAAKAAEEARIAAEAERERQEQERIAREARIAAEAAETARIAAETEAARKAKEAAEAAQREREAAERRERAAAEALAKAEREKAAAIEAARLAEEKRKAEAEAAEVRRIAAEKRAQEEADRRAAAAVEAERQERAAEAARLKRETEAREANKAHRTKINREALAPLILLGLTEGQGKGVIGAIARGEVPHVTISY